MIALVTGGSGGLGVEICRRLARDGHTVVVGCLTGIRAAEASAAGIREAGGSAMALSFDVADPEATAAAVGRIEVEFGGLDALVLAAAHNTDGLLATVPAREIVRMHAVNVAGAMNCVNAALPLLMAARGARIVLFSSVLAHLGNPGSAGYAATKGAIETLTRSLAVELGSKRIAVNAVAPGMIDAGLGRGAVAAAGDRIRQYVPLRRPGAAAEVAGAVAFLLSPDASYVNGAVLPVDGGLLIAAPTLNSGGPEGPGKGVS